MNERPSHLERYQAMSPQDCNLEMKNLFCLLPEFDTVFDFRGSGNFFERTMRVVNKLKRKRKSEYSVKLSNRMGTLLLYAKTTKSFRSWISNEFNHRLEFGISREDEEFDDKLFLSEIGYLTRLFQWDKPQGGGIFGDDSAKDIEAEAFVDAFQGEMLSLDIDDMVKKIFDDKSFVDKIKLAKEKRDFDKLFMSERKLKKQKSREQGELKYVNELQEGFKKRRGLISQWRQEYIEKYHEEPPLLPH